MVSDGNTPGPFSLHFELLNTSPNRSARVSNMFPMIGGGGVGYKRRPCATGRARGGRDEGFRVPEKRGRLGEEGSAGEGAR